MSEAPQHFDVAVVGGGPAGLAAAIASADAGARVALVAPRPGVDDWRTTALLGGSIDFLERHDVWTGLNAVAAPLRHMRLVDATSRLFRAPDVTFDAREIGRDLFGYNVANGPLVAALSDAVAARSDRIVRFEALFQALAGGETTDLLTLSSGETVSAALVIAADGRNSAVRKAAGIDVKSWSYPQEALVLALSHREPHHDTSVEFHTEAGPFTLVPHGPGRSSLVWMDRPEVIERVSGVDDAALALEIERRSGSALGAVTIDSPRQRWPISGFQARRLASGRVALVGEAAHGFPPIGAQGFNLTLRDIERMEKIIGSLMPPPAGKPFDGAAAALSYSNARRLDVTGRVTGVDLLNRSLLSGFLPLQLARATGLILAREFPPMRRLLMRAGLGG
ncbi:2-octaprenyl-6-methoxyphenyl hydroxylase [Pleomorphomonas diazotrophica]|uniref:2-octaprenyl-6-methoxyphenyl hydroxylase n=1 Tax=Pleomorphomonas diazotrophica TaxID=1166257 RepID=A0A1I4QXC8_9HYPH|nr:UbiH/UbiF family hydroxylase [Pleomorphomonas diazotrophica]PKR90352.1 2-octaprenyl-6-methoxyphenyl hydroxylase [Pleomorphomonas diazotrophica]SFM44724.1 2-octaprenyl-3-methyl-6-methoxy-1,4-benzoquinol hydroxylase [Pleomorphomonas diazotrophica]